MSNSSVVESKSLVPRPDEWLESTPLSKLWMRSWPRPIAYEHKHGAKCAELFLKQRLPRKIVASQGALYSLHEDGLWRALPEAHLESEITSTDAPTFLDVHHVKKMVQSIHQRCSTQITPFEWLDRRAGDPSPDNLMLFRNGRYDVERDALTPHDGRYFATETPSYDYLPGASCRLWDRVLDQWLDPSDQDTLHEFVGYLLTADTSLQKMLVMLGPPRSGKSTVMTVLEQLCGPVHVLSRTIDELCGQFGLQGSLGKRLMTIPDAHDADSKNHHIALNRLKSIIGKDTISINKKYGDIENVRLATRIVMAANRHPKFLDDSGALAAREVILSFQTSFLGNEDEQLGAKLSRQLSGIANMAIEGLRRLRANDNKFTRGAPAKRAALQARKDQSPAFEFASACLKVTHNQEDFVTDKMLADAYDGWCWTNGIKGSWKRSVTQLKGDLETAFAPGVTRTQRRVRSSHNDTTSQPHHGLSGIAWTYDPHRKRGFKCRIGRSDYKGGA
jgi:P4 family phage/plasmid primase-like protien